MLKYFKVQNFLSFDNETIFGLRPNCNLRSIKNKDGFYLPKQTENRLSNLALIYGANASGKTNLIKAIQFLERLMTQSFFIPQDYNLLDIDRGFLPFGHNHSIPTKFEICYLLNDQNWVYKITIEGDAKNKTITQESLTCNRKEIFTRTTDTKLYRFVTEFSYRVADNDSEITKIIEFIDSNFVNQDFGVGDAIIPEHSSTLFYYKNPEYLAKVVDILKKFDIGLNDIKIVETTNPEEPEKFSLKVYGVHSFGSLRFNKYESQGTKSLFYKILLPVITALDNGHTVYVDEIDCNIHSHILEEIIKLFVQKETNPKNAQLIATLHDVNMMNLDQVSKRQIYFVEKQNNGSSEIFSLGDFDLTASKLNYSERYLTGKLGALPFLT